VELLEVAATMGVSFDLATLRHALSAPDAALSRRLDEALRSGMIEERPARRLSYRFTHELVQRAVYERLAAVRRAELHLRVGEALESGGERSGRALADLAHHFTLAAALGDARRGVEYNVLASRAASAALAFGEAQERLRTALELPIDDPRTRAQVLLELGIAAHRGGNEHEALDAFATAAQLARRLGDHELLGRAAVGHEDAAWRRGVSDPGVVALLEEAVAALDERSGPPVRELGGLARALDLGGHHERAALVREHAIESARRADDPAATAAALLSAYWSRGTTPPEAILAQLTEARAIGERLGDAELSAEAMAWRVPTFAVLGAMEQAQRETAALEDAARRTGQPFVLHLAAHYGAALALCDGRLDRAETLANDGRDWGRALDGIDVAAVYGIQMFGIRREQGRLGELVPVLSALAEHGSPSEPWRPGLAVVLAEAGMHAEAAQELGRIADAGLESLRESLAALVYLADACTAVGDPATAGLVYRQLEPLAGANVVIGNLVACQGSADRYLGMLATTLGESERAERHFARAARFNERTGLSTWLAHTLYQHARARLARGDAAGAAPLLADAAALAERRGLPALTAAIRGLGSPAGAAEPPDGLSHREVQILLLVARGLSNREIGSALYISEHTAANHVRSILRKTGCANRTQATSYAHRHHLVEA
jgi:DNA-binding CsgD family transcriptional regulator